MMTTTLKMVVGEMMENNPKFKVGYLRANWKEIVGNLEDRSFIHYLNGKTIVVKVDNSIVLQFMRMNSQVYSKKIEKLLSEICLIDKMEDDSGKSKSKEGESEENKFELIFRVENLKK